MNLIIKTKNGKIDKKVRFMHKINVDLIDDLLNQIESVLGTSNKPIGACNKAYYIIRYEEEKDFYGNVTRYRYISPKEYIKPQDYGIDKMIEECCKILNITYEELISGARDLNSSRKRKLTAYILKNVGHYGYADIAGRLMRSGALVNTWVNSHIPDCIFTKDIEIIDWINEFADKYEINSLRV